MILAHLTAGNVPAVTLYESSGFSVYGNLRRVIRLDNGQYHDKLHMVLPL